VGRPPRPSAPGNRRRAAAYATDSQPGLGQGVHLQLESFQPTGSFKVNGAGGVTGMLLVALARRLGAEVIATAGARSAARVSATGAAHVLDRRSPDWPGQVRALTGGRGADLAVNAAPGGAARALGAVKDGGRLATITSDPPRAERGVQVNQVYVAPDGPRLGRLGELVVAGAISVTVRAPFPLEHAADALTCLHQGTNGQAVVLQPGDSAA
jgi:NADPH:quinone reductase-like Zn-dependent oxidoreductase